MIKKILSRLIKGILIGAIIFSLAEIIDLRDILNKITEDIIFFKDYIQVDIKRTKKLQPYNLNVAKILKTNVFIQGIIMEGAGTVIKKTDNAMYILTCAHVVKEVMDLNEEGYNFGIAVGYSKNNKTNISVGMVIYRAEIIKYDEDKDLALLKTSINDNELESAKIANQRPKKGDTIYSIGSPLGLVHTISKGILSNYRNGHYISDNVITFGNSGGGLYNDKGELIGVPNQVFVYGDKNSQNPESGMGLSINLDTIKDFLKGELE